MTDKIKKTKQQQLSDKGTKYVRQTLSGLQKIETLTKFNPTEQQKKTILTALENQMKQLSDTFQMTQIQTQGKEFTLSV